MDFQVDFFGFDLKNVLFSPQSRKAGKESIFYCFPLGLSVLNYESGM